MLNMKYYYPISKLHSYAHVLKNYICILEVLDMKLYKTMY